MITVANALPTSLSDGVLMLRRYRCGDEQPLFAAVRESIADLAPWLEWCHPGYSLEESTKFVASCESEWSQGNHYAFAVFERATQQLLGGVGINFINRAHNKANLGYWTRTSRAGRGYASRAARLTARFGLAELALTRLEIVAAAGNLPSQRVAEKLGATREGVLRNGLFLRSKPTDAVLYSLLPGEV